MNKSSKTLKKSLKKSSHLPRTRVAHPPLLLEEKGPGVEVLLLDLSRGLKCLLLKRRRALRSGYPKNISAAIPSAKNFPSSVRNQTPEISVSHPFPIMGNAFFLKKS